MPRYHCYVKLFYVWKCKNWFFVLSKINRFEVESQLLTVKSTKYFWLFSPTQLLTLDSEKVRKLEGQTKGTMDSWEEGKIWRYEDVKMWRCEDVNMRKRKKSKRERRKTKLLIKLIMQSTTLINWWSYDIPWTMMIHFSNASLAHWTMMSSFWFNATAFWAFKEYLTLFKTKLLDHLFSCITFWYGSLPNT